MAEITAGHGCAARATNVDDYTFVSQGHPFTDNGTCDEMGVYLKVSAGGDTLKFSVFTAVGNALTKIPDVEVPVSIATDGAEGCWQALAPGDFTAFAVTTSMYPGAWAEAHDIYYRTSTGEGIWYTGGDQTECSGKTFTYDDDGIDSLYFTGETAAAGVAPTSTLYGPLVGPLGGPV